MLFRSLIKALELIEVGDIERLVNDGQSFGGMEHDIGNAALDEFEIEDFAFRIDFRDEPVIVARVRLPVDIGNKEFLALLVADKTIGAFQSGDLSRLSPVGEPYERAAQECRPQKGAAKCAGG